MRFAYVLLCWVAVQAAVADDSNLALTVSGETYSNVTFGAVVGTSVKITHAAGVARLPLAKLPPEIQQRFGYPPKKTNDVLAPEIQALVSRGETSAVISVEATETNQPPLGTTGYLDWRYGFRDLTFGQALATCKGMVRFWDDAGDNQMFTRQDENLTLGEAKLKQVQYSFYQQKLVAVFVQIDGEENTNAVLRVLQHAYGAGMVTTNNSVLWMGDKVHAEFDPIKERPAAIFLMRSRALSQEQRDGTKAKAEREAAERKAKLGEAAKGL